MTALLLVLRLSKMIVHVWKNVPHVMLLLQPQQLPLAILIAQPTLYLARPLLCVMNLVLLRLPLTVLYRVITDLLCLETDLTSGLTTTVLMSDLMMTDDLMLWISMLSIMTLARPRITDRSRHPLLLT